MEFIKAQKGHIDAIEGIYSRIIDAQETGGSFVGWQRGVSPTRQTALDALDVGTPQSDTLYLFEDEGDLLWCRYTQGGAGFPLPSQMRSWCFTPSW